MWSKRHCYQPRELKAKPCTPASVTERLLFTRNQVLNISKQFLELGLKVNRCRRRTDCDLKPKRTTLVRDPRVPRPKSSPQGFSDGPHFLSYRAEKASSKERESDVYLVGQKTWIMWTGFRHPCLLQIKVMLRYCQSSNGRDFNRHVAHCNAAI